MPSWIRLTNPDPDTESRDPIESRSTALFPLNDRLPCGGEIGDEGENHNGGRHQQGEHLPLLC